MSNIHQHVYTHGTHREQPKRDPCSTTCVCPFILHLHVQISSGDQLLRYHSSTCLDTFPADSGYAKISGPLMPNCSVFVLETVVQLLQQKQALL